MAGACNLFGRVAPPPRPVAHAFLEAAHRAAEIRADIAQLLGAEDEQHDDQNDHPVPNTKRSHDSLLMFGSAAGPTRARFPAGAVDRLIAAVRRSNCTLSRAPPGQDVFLSP